MPKTFIEVDNDVKVVEKQLKVVADQIIESVPGVKEIDKIIASMSNIEHVSDSELSKYMIQLSSLSYSLGASVEHSNFKSACANTLMKEANAREFSLAAGTMDTKRSAAVLNTIQEQTVNMLYELVAGTLKAKLNGAHRVIDTLKNVQISRNAQAKLNQSNSQTISFATQQDNGDLPF